MFVRVKKVGPYQYLQIAQNRREGKRVKQSVIATLGRLDKLTASGAIDQLLRSAARFAERVMVLSEHSRDTHDRPDANVVSIGPALIFERLWRETGCQEVVRKLLATRHHHFDVERAVFMSVLHRLMVSGSDHPHPSWRLSTRMALRPSLHWRPVSPSCTSARTTASFPCYRPTVSSPLAFATQPAYHIDRYRYADAVTVTIGKPLVIAQATI